MAAERKLLMLITTVAPEVTLMTNELDQRVEGPMTELSYGSYSDGSIVSWLKVVRNSGDKCHGILKIVIQL